METEPLFETEPVSNEEESVLNSDSFVPNSDPKNDPSGIARPITILVTQIGSMALPNYPSNCTNLGMHASLSGVPFNIALKFIYYRDRSFCESSMVRFKSNTRKATEHY